MNYLFQIKVNPNFVRSQGSESNEFYVIAETSEEAMSKFKAHHSQFTVEIEIKALCQVKEIIRDLPME